MLRFRSAAKAALVALAVLACAVPSVAGFVLVASAFGLGAASVLLLFLIPPLVVVVRFRRRWLTVRGREIAYLVVLFCAASGAIVLVVRNWYDTGMDYRHAEDVQWARFERLIRRDPAFQNVRIKTSRKDTYWVEGTVACETDLDHLRSLAIGCGIKRDRLDGPYVHSVSLMAVRKRQADDGH